MLSAQAENAICETSPREQTVANGEAVARSAVLTASSLARTSRRNGSVDSSPDVGQRRVRSSWSRSSGGGDRPYREEKRVVGNASVVSSLRSSANDATTSG